jgi:hypothetical protein
MMNLSDEQILTYFLGLKEKLYKSGSVLTSHLSDISYKNLSIIDRKEDLIREIEGLRESLDLAMEMFEDRAAEDSDFLEETPYKSNIIHDEGPEPELDEDGQMFETSENDECEFDGGEDRPYSEQFWNVNETNLLRPRGQITLTKKLE